MSTPLFCDRIFFVRRFDNILLFEARICVFIVCYCWLKSAVSKLGCINLKWKSERLHQFFAVISDSSINLDAEAITKFSMLLQMPRHWHRPLTTQTLVGLQDLDQRCDEAFQVRKTQRPRQLCGRVPDIDRGNPPWRGCVREAWREWIDRTLPWWALKLDDFLKQYVYLLFGSNASLWFAWKACWLWTWLCCIGSLWLMHWPRGLVWCLLPEFHGLWS